MTKNAVVRGVAKWIDKNVVPNLVPRGVLRVATKGAIALANTSPDLALALLSTKYPIVQQIVQPFLETSRNDAALESVIEAFKSAVSDEDKSQEGMVVQFCEIGLWNNIPHSLVVTPKLIDDLYAEIKSAAAAERAATEAAAKKAAIAPVAT